MGGHNSDQAAQDRGRQASGSGIPVGPLIAPVIDSAYEERSTFGFNVDIGDGFVTPVPTLILYRTCGILGF